MGIGGIALVASIISSNVQKSDRDTQVAERFAAYAIDYRFADCCRVSSRWTAGSRRERRALANTGDVQW
jgi:hypothetical protein